MTRMDPWLEPTSPKHHWTPLHTRVQRSLRSRSLLAVQQRLLVAVSGGQDSLCLLQLLLDLQSQWRWFLAVIHCDHGWRSDSTANAEHVASLVAHYQLPYHCCVASHPLPNEAVARKWRYEQFHNVAKAEQCSAVLTGHTASDRAETFLHNLMRGSGLDGLAALTWTRPLTPGITLVRPLLNVTRTETGQFCQDHSLPVWEDSTNIDCRHTRNRIRLELLPQLKTRFNAQAEQHIAQTAELLTADLAFLEMQVDAYWPRVIDPTPPRWRLNRHILRDLPLALQRRLIRRFLHHQLPHAPNFFQIDKVLDLLAAPNHSQTDPFPGGVIAYVANEWIGLR